jgi:hypothetical protein
MKWILSTSLLLNLVLGTFLVLRKPSYKALPSLPKMKVKAEKPKESKEATEIAPRDFEERFEKLKDDREEMLFRLGFNSQDVQRIEEIKDRFNQKYLDVIPVDQGPDLTFEQRRRIIDIEEAREKEFQKVFGQKRWESFRRSQQDYNKKQFDELRASDKVFVPLEI